MGELRIDISEVIPGLFMASRFYPPDEWNPGLPIDCTFSLVDDGSEQSGRIEVLATYARFAMEEGLSVVLICDAGRNRSAVVAAKTLILMGELPEDAIMKVRRARRHLKGGALTNQAFVDYLRAGSQ